jgi:hypothetical protein
MQSFPTGHARERSGDLWPASIAAEGQEMQLPGLLKVF